MNQAEAILRAHETGQHLTYREVCTATGLPLKRVMNLANRLRERGVIERIGDTYPARNAITSAGIAFLHCGKSLDPVETETIVESALRTRHALAMVWPAESCYFAEMGDQAREAAQGRESHA